MGRRDLARPQVLRRLLLDLIASRPVPPERLHALTAADWQAVSDMAAQHRLGPLLHARHENEPAIPQGVREGWRGAYRYWKMAAMLARAELPRVAGFLEARGHQPIALKGAWLFAHAYPDPALRPLRDIDLLVPAESVIPAFEAMLGAGYEMMEPLELPLAELVRIDKHMPGLRSPGGVRVELHHRLWEIEGQRDHRVPLAIEAGVRARAVTVDGIRYPCREDMLAHLIVHAVYSHRLDCGPLLLTDIAYVLAGSRIDWPAFRARARREGWDDGAALVLSLVQQHDSRVPEWDGATTPGEVPSDILDRALDLLLQDLETRRSAGLFATLSLASPGAFVRRLRGQRTGVHEKSHLSRDLQAEGGFMRWMLHRTARTLTQIGSSEVRRQSRNLASISRWLDAEN